MKYANIFASAFLFCVLGCNSSPKLSEAEIAANKAKSKQSFELALQRGKEGKKDSAEALFREALELDPGTIERHFGLASFLARTKRGNEAFNIYRGALAKFGERPETYEEMAFAYNESNDIVGAVDSLRKALALRSVMVKTPENAAWIQRDEEAIKKLSGGK